MDDETREHHHADAIAALSVALRRAPDAAVGYYPEWTLRDLVVHVIGVHVMACTALGQSDTSPASYDVGIDAQASVPALTAELHRMAVKLRADVDTCPHALVWTPTRAPAPPAFWRRRMLSESILHRWDAERALGSQWSPENGLVEEVIDEFLASCLASPAAPAAAEGVTLDVGTAHWSVAVPADTIVHADPVDLWLWLNRRADARRLDVSGDAAPVAALEATLDGLRSAPR